MTLLKRNIILLVFSLVFFNNQCQGRTNQFTFQDLLNEEETELNQLKSKVETSSTRRYNIDIERKEINELLQFNENHQQTIRKNNSTPNKLSDLFLQKTPFDGEDLIEQEDEYDYELVEDISTVPQNLQRKKIFVLSQSRIKDVLGSPSIDTSVKKIDQENPMEETKKSPPPADIVDESDELLNNMNNINKLSGNQPRQVPMETKTEPQVLGPGIEDVKKEEPVQAPVEDKLETAKEENLKPEIPEKNITEGCSLNVDDGIMNCENDKNQIRQDEVNIKDIEKDIEDMPKYEISLYYGLVLCCLIIIVVLLARFRIAMSKYLEKYYIKSLRIIILDVIILMSLNTVVQIMYYNRFLDVIQLEYFNIYGFTITFAFFSISWIMIATIYAFILQKFSTTYAIYEKNWTKRNEYIDVDPEEETSSEFEERVKNIQYFLIKEDFIMPISHICYTEPMVLREDFNFAEYLGRAQAKCHLQLFNISLTTLLILISFFLIVSLIDLIEDWLIECLIFLLLPLISFSVGWIENRRQLNIIVQLITIAVHQYEIESIKFLNLDLKRPAHFSNKLKYPSYIQDQHSYNEEGISRHQSLFPFNAVQFPLKLVHFTLVLQIVWIMVFLFNYSSYLTSSWECQLIFSIGLFLILFQLFFIIPFFLKKYAVNSHIQQLKDPQIIEKVVSNQKEQVTLAFQKLYRLLKHLRRQHNPRRNNIKLRPEIIDQLKEIESLKLKSIDQLTHKLGYLNFSIDEYYYLEKALHEIQQQSSQLSSQSSLDQRTNFNLEGNNKDNKKDDQSEKPRPTANPRNQDSVLPQQQEKPKSEEEQKDEDSVVNPQKEDSKELLSPKKIEQDQDQSEINIDPDALKKEDSKDKDKQEESVNIEIDLRSSQEKKDEEKKDDKKVDSQLKVDKPSDLKQDEEQNRFILSVLIKLCSIYTQEVVLDPYKASYETLLDLFDNKLVITFEEFKRVITLQYDKIEQEKINLILHIDDIRLIIKEVFYIQDKYEKINLSRIASLIRNSIEMLPR